jgi:crotonobetainyl-CoA:carnitine CoA-transferase CaiB-like acyl-CoA transferase
MTGEGQYVDVSIQQSQLLSLHNTRLMWDMNKFLFHRTGAGHPSSFRGVRLATAQPCKDGYVCLYLHGGGSMPLVNSMRELVKYMDEVGMAPDWLKEFDWVNGYDTSKLTQDVVDRVEKTIQRFTLTKTKAELYKEAVKRRILCAPFNTAKDLAENPQLQAREYWMKVEHPELGEILTYCGPFVKLSQAPLQIKRRAPLIGEHNEEIYKEMGLSQNDLCLLKQAKVI